MIIGTLLSCPVCALTPKPQILGRLYPNGDVLILRFHSGTTLLRSGNINISCGCGFSYQLSGTVIEGTAMLHI